jgi:hypothetical protein
MRRSSVVIGEVSLSLWLLALACRSQRTIHCDRRNISRLVSLRRARNCRCPGLSEKNNTPGHVLQHSWTSVGICNNQTGERQSQNVPTACRMTARRVWQRRHRWVWLRCSPGLSTRLNNASARVASTHAKAGTTEKPHAGRVRAGGTCIAHVTAGDEDDGVKIPAMRLDDEHDPYGPKFRDRTSDCHPSWARVRRNGTHGLTTRSVAARRSLQCSCR